MVLCSSKNITSLKTVSRDCNYIRASLVVQEAFSFTYLAKQLCNNMFGAAIVLSALIVKVKNAYSSMLIALLGF